MVAVSTATSFAPTRRQRIAMAMSAIVLSTVLGLLLGEVLVRVFSPHLVRSPMIDRLNGLRSFYPGVRARAFAPGSYDTIETVSAQRFRGTRIYSPQAPPGTLRIITIGDSFTFGAGANDNESYPVVLEKVLHEHGWPVEIINAGVHDTGTGEQALYYEEYVRQFHPDVVILGVVGNDASDDVRDALFRRDDAGNLVPAAVSQRVTGRWWRLSRAIHHFEPVFWLYSHSELLSAATYELHRLSEGTLFLNKNQLGELYHRNDDLKLTEDEIGWLARRVRDSGAQLVVVFLASEPLVYDSVNLEWKRQETALDDATAAAARAAGVPFLDLRPYMRQVYAAGHPSLFHEGVDNHPNPTGYAAYARAIADFLQQSHVLSSALGSQRAESSRAPSTRGGGVTR